MMERQDAPGGRAQFHRQHQAGAHEVAKQLLAQREELQAGWLSWVAAQLYQLSPPEFAAMVRRELQQLSQDPADS
ncbi:hypothetical protein G7009_22930 [Pseudomonas capeferrum]|uniref:hypothetical protein n=1 Tax=Pseudomonas capeferrum TaxID=1495066 RepID=UPI0015E44B71|nr:hypothetical protein [Pseudomonas capeferrum]MBA1204575.1 hypothetical protein [Pseudomonas capeferrum]